MNSCMLIKLIIMQIMRAHFDIIMYRVKGLILIALQFPHRSQGIWALCPHPRSVPQRHTMSEFTLACPKTFTYTPIQKWDTKPGHRDKWHAFQCFVMFGRSTCGTVSARRRIPPLHLSSHLVISESQLVTFDFDNDGDSSWRAWGEEHAGSIRSRLRASFCIKCLFSE